MNTMNVMNMMNTMVTANTEQKQHMSLRELMIQTDSTRKIQRVPGKKKLVASGDPIDVYEGVETTLSVFQNGFVLAQVGKRYTVIRIDQCGSYRYRVDNRFLGKAHPGMQELDATPHVFPLKYFLDKAWPLRIMLEAEDRLSLNQQSRERRKLSKHPEIPDRVECYRNAMCRSAEEIVVQKMTVEEVLEKLTVRERTDFVLHDGYGYRMRELGEALGICQSTVSETLRRTRKKVRKYMES